MIRSHVKMMIKFLEHECGRCQVSEPDLYVMPDPPDSVFLKTAHLR
jgi:hypothetical protein